MVRGNKLDLIIEELNKIDSSLTTIRQSLDQLTNGSKVVNIKTENRMPTANSLSAHDLKPLAIQPDHIDWPQAVPPYMIVQQGNNAIKKFRAVQIISLLGVATSGIKILDCGCGEGHIASELSGKSQVTGYDIYESPSWSNLDGNATLTTDKHLVSKNRYDLIIVYDVIDHLEGENPEDFIKWLSSLLSSNGKLFIRFHPWTSRHGAHLYESLNKAYIHLAMTTDELYKLGLKPPHNIKVTKPLATYDNLISKSDLTVLSRKCHSETVEPFFAEKVLDRIIDVTWSGQVKASTALKIMSTQFVDYMLTK